MPRVDISALRDEAATAVERNKLDRAVELYAQLEAAEPGAAAWPKKIGEVKRRAGKPKEAIAALERAVDKFVAAGFLVQAIAVCKLILAIDATHDSTLRRVAELTAATRPLASPSDFRITAPPRRAGATPGLASSPALIVAALPTDDAPPPPPPRRVAMTVPRTKTARVSATAIEIASIVPTSRALTKTDGSLSGISLIEIELDYDTDDPAPAPVTTSLAARLDPQARLALRRTPLFADLPPRVLESLVNEMELHEFEDKGLIVREGEPGTKLYVISEGEVAVESKGVTLTTLGPSEFFGEISMVTDLPRSATIRALGHVELLAIDAATIRAAAAERPELVTVMLKFVRDRLIDRVARTSELFTPFTEADRGSLATKFELVEVVPDVELITEGQRADGLYLLLAGTVDVRRADQSIAELGTGDVFGEMSLLAGGGSTATVRTTTRVLALRLPAKIFQEVIMTHPQVLAYLGELAERRTPDADEELEFVDLHVDLL